MTGGKALARVALTAVCAGLPCCSGDEPPDEGWTLRQAESVDSVRGLPVRVLRCHGREEAGGRRYRAFSCVAGARRPGERFESVAVLYALRPTGPCCSDYELARVRFLGGPGIP